MNNFDEKDLLTRELRERSADVGGHPIGLDAVRQSARKIQRRRTIVSGAVAAVVATIAVPAGVAVTSAINDPNDPAKTPSIAASPSEQPAPTPRPDGSFPLTLQGLPRGEDPKVSYILPNERMLVTPEGGFDLPEAYSQILPYRDGWLALHGGENGWENVILDADMKVRRTVLGGTTLVPDANGSRVLLGERVTVPGRTVVVDDPTESDFERDPMNWEAPDNSLVVPVGYVDEQTVVFQTEGGEDPFIAMGRPDGSTVPLEGFLSATSASEATGLVTGQISYDPLDGSCYGVMDPVVSTSEMVWQTCDYSLFEFSPDGRYVIAGPTDYDMWGPSGLTILDTETWKPVVEFSPEKDVVGQVAQATWEDADTIAAVLVQNDEMGVVRAELSGRLELTTGTYKASDMTLQMWFAGQPRL